MKIHCFPVNINPFTSDCSFSLILSFEKEQSDIKGYMVVLESLVLSRNRRDEDGTQGVGTNSLPWSLYRYKQCAVHMHQHSRTARSRSIN